MASASCLALSSAAALASASCLALSSAAALASAVIFAAVSTVAAALTAPSRSVMKASASGEVAEVDFQFAAT